MREKTFNMRLGADEMARLEHLAKGREVTAAALIRALLKEEAQRVDARGHAERLVASLLEDAKRFARLARVPSLDALQAGGTIILYDIKRTRVVRPDASSLDVWDELVAWPGSKLGEHEFPGEAKPKTSHRKHSKR